MEEEEKEEEKDEGIRAMIREKTSSDKEEEVIEGAWEDEYDKVEATLTLLLSEVANELDDNLEDMTMKRGHHG